MSSFCFPSPLPSFLNTYHTSIRMYIVPNSMDPCEWTFPFPSANDVNEQEDRLEVQRLEFSSSLTCLSSLCRKASLESSK